MESKIIEYGIILLHKYKIEQTEVISRLLQYSLFYSQITRTFGQIEHLHHEFRKYSSSNHNLRKYKALNQTVVKNINMFF